MEKLVKVALLLGVLLWAIDGVIILEPPTRDTGVLTTQIKNLIPSGSGVKVLSIRTMNQTEEPPAPIVPNP